MKITIDIPDSAIKAHIDTISDCIGIDLTPTQFVDISQHVGYSLMDLQDYGFGDSMYRDSFLRDFIVDILQLPPIPTYGDKLSDEAKKQYWATLQMKAITAGYALG